jgi:hypothetical protein
MQTYAVQKKLTPFISMQNHYNLLYREEEREMMPTLKVWHCIIVVERQYVLTILQHFGVGSIPWSPLARGRVCRPFSVAKEQATVRHKSDWFADWLYQPEEYKPIVDATETVAKARGITMAQVALAWILSKEQVSAPIVGTTSLENLHELISASHWKSLSQDSANATRRGRSYHAHGRRNQELGRELQAKGGGRPSLTTSIYTTSPCCQSSASMNLAPILSFLSGTQPSGQRGAYCCTFRTSLIRHASSGGCFVGYFALGPGPLYS